MPRAVIIQANKANRAIDQNISDRELRPRRGAPRTAGNYKKPPIVIGQSADELDRQFNILEAILGPRGRGNKRWGRIAFYADLMVEFQRLQGLGITLPGNRHLSAAACSHGLGDVLRRHGHTRFSDINLIRTSAERTRIARKLHTAFTRLRHELNKYLPKDR